MSETKAGSRFENFGGPDFVMLLDGTVEDGDVICMGDYQGVAVPADIGQNIAHIRPSRAVYRHWRKVNVNRIDLLSPPKRLRFNNQQYGRVLTGEFVGSSAINASATSGELTFTWHEFHGHKVVALDVPIYHPIVADRFHGADFTENELKPFTKIDGTGAPVFILGDGFAPSQSNREMRVRSEMGMARSVFHGTSKAHQERIAELEDEVENCPKCSSAPELELQDVLAHNRAVLDRVTELEAENDRLVDAYTTSDADNAGLSVQLDELTKRYDRLRLIHASEIECGPSASANAKPVQRGVQVTCQSDVAEDWEFNS